MYFDWEAWYCCYRDNRQCSDDELHSHQVETLSPDKSTYFSFGWEPQTEAHADWDRLRLSKLSA